MTATMDAPVTPIPSDRSRIGRMKKMNGLGDLETHVLLSSENTAYAPDFPDIPIICERIRACTGNYFLYFPLQIRLQYPDALPRTA